MRRFSFSCVDVGRVRVGWAEEEEDGRADEEVEVRRFDESADGAGTELCAATSSSPSTSTSTHAQRHTSSSTVNGCARPSPSFGAGVNGVAG